MSIGLAARDSKKAETMQVCEIGSATASSLAIWLAEQRSVTGIG